MKYSLVVAALVGSATAVQRHHHKHHHNYIQTRDDAPAEAAADPGAEDAGAAAAEVKEAAKEKMPTAEDVKKEAAEVLKPKPTPQGSESQRAWAEARADDAAEAASVAKHDALGKSIIADMYKGRAQKKLDDAAAAEKAQADMVEVLKKRIEINEAAEKARQAAAFKAHKAHVLHVKEHYAKLEADAAKEVADAHAAWKAKYGAQKRLPLDTAGETWTANMPDHVIEDGDFHVKAPAPVDKLLKDAKAAEDKAEADAAPKKEAAAAEEAAPAFVQLYRRRNLAQQKAESESESESSASDDTSSSDTSSSGSGSD